MPSATRLDPVLEKGRRSHLLSDHGVENPTAHIYYALKVNKATEGIFLPAGLGAQFQESCLRSIGHETRRLPIIVDCIEEAPGHAKIQNQFCDTKIHDLVSLPLDVYPVLISLRKAGRTVGGAICSTRSDSWWSSLRHQEPVPYC